MSRVLAFAGIPRTILTTAARNAQESDEAEPEVPDVRSGPQRRALHKRS
jgi:hypothetical protein